MNVLILTPDRVGSTLLQRLITVYMLRRGFDKPVINLHELTNGLTKYYNETLNREVLGKPEGTNWGYVQSLPEIESLLKSTDHYKTSRLAHYHIVNRKDSISDQIKFYEYLNQNFFIISCRRKNLFEYALSWAINGHSKVLNVYSPEQKINAFSEIYRNGITVNKETLVKYLNKYKDYISWSDNYFNVQSYFEYDTDIHDVEKYILNLDFMNGHSSNSWKDMFGQEFSEWNSCHRLLPNLKLRNSQDSDYTIDYSTKAPILENFYNDVKGTDWPENFEESLNENSNVPEIIKKEMHQILDVVTVGVTAQEHSFLKKNLKTYMQTNIQMQQLVDNGFLVTNIPIKLQSLSEKKRIVKNFDESVEWYNQWAKENNYGEIYSETDLAKLSLVEESQLNKEVEEFRLLT